MTSPAIAALPALRRRLHGLSFVDEFGPVYAVYTLWFSDNGITAGQLSTVFLIWAVVALALEIPSGALADVVDRRRLLAVAFAIRAVGIGLWLVWPTLTGIIIGAVLWAIHDALASGAWEAMIHDQLSALGAADRYGPMMARIGQFSHLGVAAGTLLGAALLQADVDLVVLGWLTVAAHAGSITLVATLPAVGQTDLPDEDEDEDDDEVDTDTDTAVRAAGRPVVAVAPIGVGDRSSDESPGPSGWLTTLRAGVRQAGTDPLVLRLVAVGALLEGLWVVDEYLPLVSRVQGGSDAAAPILILIVWIGLLAGGEVAARRPEIGGRLLGPALLVGTAIMVLALAAGQVWALALVAVGYAALETTRVVADARLQARTRGEVRATVASVRGFGAAAISMAMFVIIGAMATGDDPRPGLYVLLGVLAAVAVLTARWVPGTMWGVPPTVVEEPRG
ncbi:MAG: MFS transporter [Actinomycetota bacterium]